MLALVLALLSQLPSPPPDATPTRRGLVNTGAQSFRGVKNFVDGGVYVDGQQVLTATTATLTLYVDPTGNDSNACTASGTAACATLAAALRKLPAVSSGNITINIATGTYAVPFDFEPRIFLARGTTLAVVGTLVTSTLATGASTGTTTTSTGGSQSGPASFTDSAQTWTTNDLRGRFVTFASGTLSGQTLPITSNTATSLTIPNANGPGVGVAYTIVDPGVVFNGGTSTARISNVSGPGALSFSNIAITRGAGQLGVMQSVVDVSARVIFTSCKISNHSSNSFTFQVAGGKTDFSRCIIQSVSGSSALSYTSGATVVHASTGSMTASFVTATSNSAVTVSGANNLSVSSVAAEGGGSSGGVLSISAASLAAFGASVWLTCLSGGTGWSSATPGAFSVTSSTLAMNGFLRIQNCGTGISVSGPSYWVVNGITFDTVTTAVEVKQGGVVNFLGSTPTFTGVTNELSVDGTFSTFSALTALPAPQALSNAFGSRIIR